MSGYPGSGYPTQGGGYPGSAPPRPAGGYPGSAPPQGGYPGAAPSGGYPGSAPPTGSYPGSAPPPGGYPGSAPRPAGGYPGSAPPQGGYPGSAPPQGGYPGSAPPQGGYPGSAPPQGGYPGYGAPQQPPVDPQVQQWFNAVDQDRSGQITAGELSKALVNGNWSNFSEEACRMMIEMFDKDKKGTITVHEFGSLFAYINQWKATFEAIDKDRSGFIEQAELNQAFQQMGFRFSPTFVQNLLAKYDPKTRRLSLDNFIVACVQIQRLTTSFKTRDREMRGQATMAYEDFVGIALGAHN